MNRDTCGPCGAPSELCECAGSGEADLNTEYEKRIGADQPPTERMAFNDWWNAPITTHSTEDNPYRLRSPAYWAWEGWQAGTKAEREACAAICERHATAFLDGEELSDWKSGYGDGAGACFNVIRARGQE